MTRHLQLTENGCAVVDDNSKRYSLYDYYLHLYGEYDKIQREVATTKKDDKVMKFNDK